MQLGFIGLGKMGNRMVTKLLDGGHEVVVWNRTKEKIENLKFKIENLESAKRLDVADSIQGLVKKLDPPRIVWSMLPAGEATEEILGEVEKYVQEGDIVIDGGNAYFEDTQRRYEHFSQKGIKFLGIGVSGGVIAAAAGYPLMVGGDKDAYDHVKPILDSLAAPAHSTSLRLRGRSDSRSSGQGGGHEYFGEGGAGHFVKMVHNGIEYGYMQAIGEGFGVFEKAPYGLDLVAVAKLYTKGTLLSGFMMDRTVEALETDPKLEKIEGYIEASGEGEWTVKQAEKENVPIDVIKCSLDFRTQSRTDSGVSSSFAARMVAALRKAFGGHETRSSVIPAPASPAKRGEKAGIKKVDSRSLRFHSGQAGRE